jgi:thiol-disulfide isomerase/thioredoxin
MSKSVRFNGVPSLTATTGGSVSGMFSGMRNTITSLSWRTTGIIILVIILAIIGYMVYKNYIEPSINPRYKANREQVPVGSGSSANKEAEIMLFYTDWCPHCKTAKPEWEQVKAEYDGKKIHGYTIIFTEVNCTNDSPDVEKMLNTYKVEGYPTIKLVKDNQIVDYDAKPSKATLTQFLNTVV